jgi:hypothetical protein
MAAAGLVAGLSSGCEALTGEDGEGGERAGRNAPQTLAEAEQFRFASGMDARARLVLRSREDWVELWAQLGARSLPAPPTPVVDFDTQVVVVAAAGTRRSGGYAIYVTGVEATVEGARIRVLETSPARECVTTAALTQPTAVVVVPRFEEMVSWIEAEQELNCR